MAFRFRKSFKIAPGVRLNVGKRGGSLSIGGRGATVNISSRGTRATFGIPGTGIGYSTSRGRSRRSASYGPTRRQLEAQQRAALREQARNQALAVVASEEAQLVDLVEQWRDVPPLPSRADYEAASNPMPFAYDEPEPAEPDAADIRDELARRIRAAVLDERGTPVSRFFMVGVMGMVISATAVMATWVVASSFAVSPVALTEAMAVVLVLFTLLAAGVTAHRHAEAIRERVQSESDRRWEATWARARDRYDEACRQHREAMECARALHDEYEAQRITTLKALLAGDTDEMAAVIEAALSDQSFPFEALCQVAVDERGEAYILLDLPEIEDVIPETEARVLRNGEIRKKKRPARDRQQLYAQLVCGLAYQVARIAFEAAPTLELLRIAAYTQRRDRHGELQDEFVFEFEQSRSANALFDYRSEDPVEALSRDPGGRIKLTSTHKLSRISAPRWMADVLA